MIATLWRFRAGPDVIDAFERHCGPRGDWAKLFARAGGHAGIERLRLEEQPTHYLTIDRWHSRERFKSSQEELSGDYAELDRRCEAYTSEETWLGLHTIVE